MKGHLKNLQVAFSEVFASTSYIALASALAILVFLFAVWLPNIGLLVEVFDVSSTPFATKFKLAWSLLGGIRTNFSMLSAGYTIAIAVLFGINVAMIVYFLKHTRARLAGRDVAVGLGGITSGILGVGCAACGSFLLMIILSSFGAAGILAYLPLAGGEFGILGVLLLIISLFFTAKVVTEPPICKT